MGSIGVAFAALATHAGGGEVGATAALFLILHAAALLGLSAHMRVGEAPKGAAVAGFALAAGAILFSGALSAHVFLGVRLPFVAPIGGVVMVLAWLALAISFGAARSS
jgi:uncharacterized membrane protein YgdD (TMEM256/DUF423 family)